VLKDGFIAPHDTPGLGVKLKPDLRDRADAHVMVSAA
jgi:L-alanine-DL-glutamate epimerase-like enolase superfamily enzyme